MKCRTCGAWTEVLETRKADRGHTLVRTRQCANKHRFKSYEVLEPIYKRDPPTVRQTVVAAEVRAAQWRRDLEIVKRKKTETVAEIAANFGLTEAAIKKALVRMRKQPT